VAAVLLRRFDSRLVASAGLIAVAIASASVAGGLTVEWGPQQFLPSQVLQSLGQTMALSGVVFTSVLHMRKDIQLTFGAMIQTARLMGGEIGLAFTETFVRTREQHASNLLGQHVVSGDYMTTGRISAYAGAVGPQSFSGQIAGRATALLSSAVHQAADLQSCIDGFLALAVVAAAALVVIQLLGGAPDGPAKHRPIRWKRLFA
jgi:DHA2 family multidrug resistance protein